MLNLKIKKDQKASVKLKNGIRLKVDGNKNYDQSFLELLYENGFDNLVEKVIKEKKIKEK